MKQPKIINWGLFVLLSLIWGSSFILMKWSKESLSGIQIGALRILFAGLAVLPFALFHIASVPRRKLPLVLLSGLLGNLAPAFLFAIAIAHNIDSSLAGILNSLTPLLVILIGVAFFGTKLAPQKTIGVIIGFVGLCLLSLAKGGISLQNFGYASLILLATLSYAINVHLAARYLKEVHPVKMTAISLAGMSIPAAMVAWRHHTFSLIWYDEGSRTAVAATALLGIVGSAVATVMFYALIKRAGPLFASLVTYGIPVVAIMWGIVASEPVTIIQVACLAMILGGVWVANGGKSEKSGKLKKTHQTK